MHFTSVNTNTSKTKHEPNSFQNNWLVDFILPKHPTFIQTMKIRFLFDWVDFIGYFIILIMYLISRFWSIDSLLDHLDPTIQPLIDPNTPNSNFTPLINGLVHLYRSISVHVRVASSLISIPRFEFPADVSHWESFITEQTKRNDESYSTEDGKQFY